MSQNSIEQRFEKFFNDVKYKVDSNKFTLVKVLNDKLYTYFLIKDFDKLKNCYYWLTLNSIELFYNPLILHKNIIDGYFIEKILNEELDKYSIFFETLDDDIMFAEDLNMVDLFDLSELYKNKTVVYLINMEKYKDNTIEANDKLVI